MNILKLLLVLLFLYFMNKVYSQFNQLGPILGGDRYGATTGTFPNNIKAVGIGQFTNANPPQSALHINTNFLTPVVNNPLTFTSGEVFRTTGPSAQDNAWRMFTGPKNGIQSFSLTTLSNFGGIRLSSAQNQFMEFWTNNTLRMHINPNISPSNQGFIGMGNSFSAPQSRLHINEMNPVPPVNGGTANYVQWTNTATGNATENEGLRVGLSGNGTAEIRQQENLPLLFYTNNIETARMLPNTATTLVGNTGMFGLGNFSPTGPNTAAADVVNAKLDIDGDLRIRTVTQDNTLTQVLAIDPTDKNRVHWVDATNFTGGSSVTAQNGISIVGTNTVEFGLNPLLHNTNIPLNNFNLSFSGTGTSGQNNVSIGTTTAFGKLNVTNDTEPFGIFVSTANPSATTVSIGVEASASGSTADNYAGRFHAFGTTGRNIGMFARAENAPNGNIAIWGFAPPLQGSFAALFQGNVLLDGNLVGLNNVLTGSDAMFKTNINSISNASQIISQLSPRTFFFDTTNFSQFNFNSTRQYGLIAQEVEQVLPELVQVTSMPAQIDSSGNIVNAAFNFKTLNYNAFIAILMKGMQEQKQLIDSLMNAVATLSSCVEDANLCNLQPVRINNTHNKSIEMVNVNSIILDQNLPNPFADHTVINYNIPAEVNEAKLLFYDLNGRIIKELIIEERGESKLTVYGVNLKTGVYTYSLIADGELIATKKMVKK